MMHEGPPGTAIGLSPQQRPGVYWFIVKSVQEGAADIYTNCVQVTVQAVAARLSVSGSDVSAHFVNGQSLPVYASGFAPRTTVVGWVYRDSTECGGLRSARVVGRTDAAGAYEGSVMLSNNTSNASIRFDAAESEFAAPTESTNCVRLLRGPDQTISLTVNGSTGPVLDDDGEIHLEATGLPAGGVVYPVLGCSGYFEPRNDDFGTLVGLDGLYEAYLSDDLPDAFWIRVALNPATGEPSSNCVQVRMVSYPVDPTITIGPPPGVPEVTAGTPFDIVAAAFPPELVATVRVYRGDDCVGESTLLGANTDADGEFTLATTVAVPGTISIRAEVDEWMSNCATATVLPTQLTGPIVLRADGQTAPQTVAAGTEVGFTAEGLNSGEDYQLRWYPAAECAGIARLIGRGTGEASGAVGALTRTVTATVNVQLTAGERTSNCVAISWLGDPAGPEDPGDPNSPSPDTSLSPDASMPFGPPLSTDISVPADTVLPTGPSPAPDGQPSTVAGQLPATE